MKATFIGRHSFLFVFLDIELFKPISIFFGLTFDFFLSSIEFHLLKQKIKDCSQITKA